MLGSLVLCIFPIAFTFASDPSSRVKLHNTAHYNALFMGWSKENRIEFKDDLDYQVRLEVFSRNNDFIEEHNTAASFGEHSYTLAHNEFSHLSWEEFKKHYLGVLPKSEVSSKRAKGVSNDDAVQDLPGSVDWVERGAVTSVKNQGMCGSCWAFSAIGALEGALAIATGNLIDLSEEQLLDCDKVDQGCDGGEMYSAFDWMKEAGGVCAAEDYPYTGILPPFKKCRMDCKPVDGTQVSGWIRANANEKSVMAAVSERPLAVSIEADQMAFQFYRDGVFNAACGTDLDHGVVLVGYGTSEEGQEYWKVKNSWGSSWGKEGYILLARNDNQGDSEGECGILMDATYPILAQESGLIAIESEVSTPLLVTPIKASIPLSFEEARGRYRSIERAINDMLNSLYDTIFFLPTPIFSSSESSAASSMVMLGSIKEWNALFEEDESEYLGHNSADVVDCGGGAAVFEQIDVVPSVPSRGKPISLKAYGVLTKPIESGTYKLSVQMGGTVVYEHQGSICGKSEAGLPLGLGKIVMVGFDCPSNPGPVNYSMDVELPIISPPGHYTISLTGVDQDQIALVCLKANLSL